MEETFFNSEAFMTFLVIVFIMFGIVCVVFGIYVILLDKAEQAKARAKPKESSYWLKLDTAESINAESVINGIQRLAATASATGQNFNRITAVEQGRNPQAQNLVVILANNNSLQTTVINEEAPDQLERIAKLEALLKTAEIKIEMLEKANQQLSKTLTMIAVTKF